MGTNYYARYELCSHCNRYEEIHIGKSSMNFKFMFHATDEIKSYEDWIKFLSRKKTKIFDEYGNKISLKDFKKKVAEKQKAVYNNIAELNQERMYLDKDRYSMSPYEFR